ncbi:6159_t:CDS:10 [Funneliformis mosseae]|uniref:6159_t:CDS:1 n=1 Tax=Funneliformis mosseae TaxID=27381 RepID=A0A9N8ZTJ2_FUNMO|nr:6159_t:CDS:10 [Funneliformis mosseae]
MDGLNNSDLGTIHNFQSLESKFMDDDDDYLATSPNGNLAVTFNPVSFSLAISDSSNVRENEEDAFVAVSCFCDKDMMSDDDSVENSRNLPDAEKGDDFKTEISAETFVFFNKRGGIVRFLNNNSVNESNGFTNLIVMNASGIAKAFIDHRNSYVIDLSNFSVAQVYEFPTYIQMKIDKLYHSLACTDFLNSLVEQNFLFVEDDNKQKLEMFNLQSLDLELTFHKSFLPNKAKNSIFSTSKHGHLLAYYNDEFLIGTPPITINQDQKDTLKYEEFNDKNEPWAQHMKYNPNPIYFDEEQNDELLIGKTTVQIWRKKKVLKYIWVNPSNKMINVYSLKIGKGEFFLDLSWPSISANVRQKVNIHWPNEAHVLKDACVAMEYLNARSYEIVGRVNLRKYIDLVECTEKLIKKCIKENPDLWSLSEVRNDIMANIIRSRNLTLLYEILFEHKAMSINKIKRDDLIIAINESSGGHRNDTVIVAMLLEYYSNNAEKDTSWMFTLIKALPSLNNPNLKTYLNELFYKPCFGFKELIDSKFVKPGKLKKDIKRKFFKKLKERSKVTDDEVTLTKVRVVPLPDFTIYPTKSIDRTHSNWMITLKLIKLIFWPRGYLVRSKDQRSPFLKLLKIMKMNYYMKSSSGSILYAHVCILYGTFETYEINESLLFFYVLIFYFGYYLLATEFLQLKNEGFKKYWSIYNFFDLASIIVSIFTMINNLRIYFKWAEITSGSDYDTSEPSEWYYYQYLKEHGVTVSDDIKEVVIPQAFSVLLLWFELLMTIVAFGHAMYIILRYPNDIGLEPNGDSYVVDSPYPDGTIDFKISQDFDMENPIDNFYVSFAHSVMGVYFWILGRWDQLENLLVAFMMGVYDEAKNNVKLSVLNYRANLIADYEPLEKPFGSQEGIRDIFIMLEV